MNAFVRKMTILSILWAALEMLLPDEKRQPVIRMIMGVLVMTSLLSQAGTWMGRMAGIPAWSERTAQVTQEMYLKTALRSQANQTEAFCIRLAQKAGYQAQAGVWLRMDGSIDKVILQLKAENSPLLTREILKQHLAEQLGIHPECILLEEL